MGDLLEVLGIAAIATWAAFVFGWPAALLVAGVGALVAGLALSEVSLRQLLRRRPRPDPNEQMP